MAKKPYTRDSLERALIHHDVTFYKPEPSTLNKWIISAIGRESMVMTDAECYFYVLGLADARRKHENVLPAALANGGGPFQIGDVVQIIGGGWPWVVVSSYNSARFDPETGHTACATEYEVRNLDGYSEYFEGQQMKLTERPRGLKKLSEA